MAWPRMVAWLPTTRPSSFGYFYSPRLQRRIGIDRRHRRAAAPWDLVFVHCSSVAPYVADAPGEVKIIDFGDMDSQKWREYSQHKPFPLSAGYWLEAVKLERTERLLAGQFDLATCTTRAEMESLKALGVTGAHRLVPERRGCGASSSPSGPAVRARPGQLRRSHGLLPEPAGGDQVLRRGAARDSASPPWHALRDRRR